MILHEAPTLLEELETLGNGTVALDDGLHGAVFVLLPTISLGELEGVPWSKIDAAVSKVVWRFEVEEEGVVVVNLKKEL